MPPLILASSSVYRRQLLERIGVAFTCHSPNIDETPRHSETTPDLVKRLAIEKAQAIAKTHTNHLIIGSDQATELNGTILGKPGSHQNAVAQLESCSGQKVTFYTSVCLLNSSNNIIQASTIPFSVYFKKLSYEQIERYVCKEQPYDCAGSFKMEGYGICLFEKMEGDDPNSLIGLPLIKLITMLEQEGIKLP